jgi:hypothetical protein
MTCRRTRCPGRGPLLLLLSLLAASASAQQVERRLPCDASLPCNELVMNVALPGLRSAELSLRFEQAYGLTANSFRLTAQLVDTDDPGLAKRLPSGVFVNPRMPLLLGIARTTGTATSFRGMWQLDLRTDALDFDSSSPPTRVFQSLGGGNFVDVTSSVGMGSFHALAAGGDFGELLVVSDLRPPRRTALSKYNEIEQAVEAGASAGQISPATTTALLAQLQLSRAAFLQGNDREARRQLDAFATEARVRSGAGTLLDHWDPSVGKVSRAGILRALAASLGLSLEIGARPRTQSTASLVRALTTEGGKRLELILSFPSEVGDLADSLDISVHDIDPGSAEIRERLPAGVKIPASFPVLIRINPKADSRPAFRGAWELEVRTRELEFLGDSPLRLFKSPDGGQFEDITATAGVGSYRAKGKTPGFSEFVIAADNRSLDQVTEAKLDALEDLLAGLEGQIGTAVADRLNGLLGEARERFEEQRFRSAIDSMEAFSALVEAEAGTSIPDIFRTRDSRSNAAGLLLSAAHSLQLSLTLQRNLRLLAVP